MNEEKIRLLMKKFNNIKAKINKLGDAEIYACDNRNICLPLGYISEEDIITSHFSKDISEITQEDINKYINIIPEEKKEEDAIELWEQVYGENKEEEYKKAIEYEDILYKDTLKEFIEK